MMSGPARDFRFAIRLFRKRPGFALLSITALALGIGANSAIFSVVYAVLLKPLPYQDPHQLVLFWESDPQLGQSPLSEGGFLDWRSRNTVFSAMAGFRSLTLTLTGRGSPQPLAVTEISPQMLPLLGAEPLQGRNFLPEEEKPGAGLAALLSFELWQSAFGGEAGVVGQTIRLDGDPYLVVGILPDDFLFPPPVSRLGDIREFEPAVYIPLICDPESRTSYSIYAAARLKPATGLRQAQASLDSLAEDLVRDYPDYNFPGLRAALYPLHEQGVSQSRTPLLVLLGSVFLILMIACFNVATLLLVQGAGRFKEVSIRMALGAGRGHIVSQMLAESLLLALLAGLSGIVLAFLSLESLISLGSGHIPLLSTVSINGPVLAFTLAVALATSLLFGLAPVLQSTRLDLNEALKEGSRQNSEGSGRRRLHSAILVAEIALAVVLLAGAGLLVKSLYRLQQVELGFDSQNLLTFHVRFPESGYPEWDHIRRFPHLALPEIRSLAGVLQAGAVDNAPLTGGRRRGLFEIEGRLASTPEERKSRLAHFYRVTPGYFEAMQIALRQGRFISDQDRLESRPVCVIDRTMAERFWPQGEAKALGARITRGDPSNPEAVWYDVVGIAQSVRHSGPEGASQGAVYLAFDQSPGESVFFVVRSGLQAEALAPALRQRLSSIDPDLPLVVRSYDSYLYEAQSSRRAPTVLLGVFAGLALILALGGLFGVLSYLVSRRTREIGVRIALGAQRSDILRLVGRQTLLLVALGVVIGLGGAWALSIALPSMLYQVSPGDPSALAAAAALFILVAGLAAFFPVRKACRVDPIEALRSE